MTATNALYFIIGIFCSMFIFCEVRDRLRRRRWVREDAERLAERRRWDREDSSGEMK